MPRDKDYLWRLQVNLVFVGREEFAPGGMWYSSEAIVRDAI
jgi:hypothetical protein